MASISKIGVVYAKCAFIYNCLALTFNESRKMKRKLKIPGPKTYSQKPNHAII
jgi:hypothetical protein